MDVEAWLQSTQLVKRTGGLEKIQKALDLLGNPEGTHPVIHVAGTNGKGSTVAFLQNLFMAHKKNVGAFVSPHLETVYDRFLLNGVPITKREWDKVATEVQKIERCIQEELGAFTYFEALTVMMFLYFSRKKVDVVVVEVGIGGLLDVTNVVHPVVSIITSVGLDHQAILGNTIEEIAQQKAGILKEHTCAVVGPVSEPIHDMYQRICQQKSIQLSVYGEQFVCQEGVFSNDLYTLPLTLQMKGAYQYENASVALEAFCMFMVQQEGEIQPSLAVEALKETYWAGRLEVVHSSPTIIIDGAHNVHALERFIEFIQPRQKRAYILFAALKRKDYKEMLDVLVDNVEDATVFVTTFEYEGAATKKEYGQLPNDIEYIADYKAWIQNWITRHTQEELYILGSLYFISEVREWLKEL